MNAASRSLFISEICFETFNIRFLKETVKCGSNKMTVDKIQITPDVGFTTVPLKPFPDQECMRYPSPFI